MFMFCNFLCGCVSVFYLCFYLQASLEASDVVNFPLI